MRTLIRQNRDPRIDFFRGFALWSMFIDHLIKSWLRLLTLKNFAFCDTAELFVLLSGLAAGIVYTKSLERHGLLPSWSKALHRVVGIYRTHLLMFILFLAEAGFLISWLNPASFVQLLNLDAFVADPFKSLWDGVLLRYQPKFFDILPLYLALLLMLCVVMPLLRKPRLLLSLSVLLYAGTRLFSWHLPEAFGSWFFNPLAWQLVFVLGVVGRPLLRSHHYSRTWDVLAAAFAVFSLVESNAKHLVRHVPGSLLISFPVDKPGLHPLRVLAIVSVSWLAWRFIPATSRLFHSLAGRCFILLGQHSLPVFAGSVLLAVFGQAILFTHPGVVSQIWTQGVGSICLLLIAAFYSRRKHPVTPVRELPLSEAERVLVA